MQGIRPGLRLAVAIAVAAAAAPAASAQELSFVEAEIVPAPPPSVCTEVGLGDVAVSPDGAHLYVNYEVCVGTDQIAAYARGADGALTFVGFQASPANPTGLAITPDGAGVVAIGNNGDVWSLRRDAQTGLLAYADSVYDGQGPVQATQYARDGAISPDGANLYVVGQENAITTFSLDSQTGALDFVDVDADGSGGLSLQMPDSVAVTPDGAFVVAASATAKRLTVFARDGATGALSFASAFVDGAGGVDGLDGAVGIATAPRVGAAPPGASVYVASWYDASVTRFGQDAGGVAFEAAPDVGSYPTALAVSPDGTRLFVSDVSLNRVAALERDPATGATGAVVGQVAKDDPGVAGLTQPYAIAVSPDGANVYATSSTEDAVAVLSVPVPEPSVSLLGVVALALLGCRRRA